MTGPTKVSTRNTFWPQFGDP